MTIADEGRRIIQGLQPASPISLIERLISENERLRSDVSRLQSANADLWQQLQRALLDKSMRGRR